MRKIEVGGLTLSYYSSDKEIPAGRFKDFQKYLFEAWGVGSSIQDVDQRLANAYQMIANGAKDKALQELQNFRLTLNYILNKVSVKQYAFAILVTEINGRKCPDFSESALGEVITEIETNLTQGEIEQVVDEVKKNLKLI